MVEEKHYMIKEIMEAPKAVQETVKALKSSAREIKKFLEERGIRKGFIIGSGTSFHASLALQYLINKYTKLHFTAIPASEFEDWRPLETEDYIIVGYSQSGESSDIIKAIRVAKEKNIPVIGITNTSGSTLTKISDLSLVTMAGEEKAVAATKTYDVQLAAGSVLAYTISDKNDLLEKLEKEIPKILENVISKREEIREVANEFKGVEDIFILGRAANYANALEAGLKLKEAAMIHSEGFAVREFLHGPIQLVGKENLVMVFLPTRHSFDGSLKTLNKLKSYNVPVIGIVGKGLNVEEYVTKVIEIPLVEDDLSIFPVVKAVQIFAYYISIARGLNPDAPTKLTKVVK
ncbi:MAG TPA: SIS domain-containing protein [Thermoprotei archaeon]|nr:SIS domain-containing protein [Thermoprotei archaeon]